MLVKAFELHKPNPFFVKGGKFSVGMKTLMPVSPRDFTDETRENYRVLSPSFNNDINFYGITTGGLNLRMVVVSDGLRTYFYWFTKRNRYSLMVRSGCNNLEDAWLLLFKWIIGNPCEKCFKMYAILKHFMRQYFKYLGERELNITLSVNYGGSLLYVEIIKESFVKSAMFVIVDGKKRLVEFNYHPLIKVLEFK